jgi:hypothetical protein
LVVYVTVIINLAVLSKSFYFEDRLEVDDLCHWDECESDQLIQGQRGLGDPVEKLATSLSLGPMYSVLFVWIYANRQSRT